MAQSFSSTERFGRGQGLASLGGGRRRRRRSYVRRLIEALVDLYTGRAAQGLGHLTIIALEHRAEYCRLLSKMLVVPRRVSRRARLRQVIEPVDVESNMSSLSSADLAIADAMVRVRVREVAIANLKRVRRQKTRRSVVRTVGSRESSRKQRRDASWADPPSKSAGPVRRAKSNHREPFRRKSKGGRT